eukprot:286555-Chlamydomonas_euryale.AAC.1
MAGTGMHHMPLSHTRPWLGRGCTTLAAPTPLSHTCPLPVLQALERGVITSSAGNHAQGVALAASKLGCKATICMPVNTPDIKCVRSGSACKRAGGGGAWHPLPTWHGARGGGGCKACRSTHQTSSPDIKCVRSGSACKRAGGGGASQAVFPT